MTEPQRTAHAWTAPVQEHPAGSLEDLFRDHPQYLEELAAIDAAELEALRIHVAEQCEAIDQFDDEELDALIAALDAQLQT
jgi:hypothetical protein